MEREMGLAGFGWDRVPPVKMVGLISEHRPNNSAGHDDDVKCFDGDAIGVAIGRRANGDEKCFRWSFVICAHMGQFLQGGNFGHFVSYFFKK